MVDGEELDETEHGFLTRSAGGRRVVLVAHDKARVKANTFRIVCHTQFFYHLVDEGEDDCAVSSIHADLIESHQYRRLQLSAELMPRKVVN